MTFKRETSFSTIQVRKKVIKVKAREKDDLLRKALAKQWGYLK